jgi:hypothetical protein
MTYVLGTRRRESKIRVVCVTYTDSSQNCLSYVEFSYYNWEDKTSTKLGLQNLKRTGHLDELNVDGKLLTFILKKYGVRMTAY